MHPVHSSDASCGHHGCIATLLLQEALQKLGVQALDAGSHLQIMVNLAGKSQFGQKMGDLRGHIFHRRDTPLNLPFSGHILHTVNFGRKMGDLRECPACVIIMWSILAGKWDIKDSVPPV